MRAVFPRAIYCQVAVNGPARGRFRAEEQYVLTEQARKEWLRHLLPLPKDIRIEGEIACSVHDISVRAETGSDVVRHAAGRVAEALGLGAGHDPSAGQLEIQLGVADEAGRLGETLVEVDRLREVPNSDQAYLIQMDGRARLVLAALADEGVSNAAATLVQLVEPFVQGGRARIPLPRVIDWPDMDERGLWNFPDPESWIPWMSSLKLNYGKMASTDLDPVRRREPNHARIDRDLMARARLTGFRYVPYLLHLNFLHGCGLFQAYPELAGKGEGALSGRYVAHKTGNQHRVPCASQPLLAEILAEWMADIASQGAGEVSCWLSERPAQCECPECTRVGQFVLEARAFTAACRKVRETFPELRIRMFLSTTTTGQNYRVLSELDPEIKVERACATGLERVPHVPRDLMANPLLDHYAARGRWIASYDVPIGAFGRVDTPEFKVPHCSAHRIRDYVSQLQRRNYSGAYGMMAWATQGREVCGFSIAALAEWSWNLNGRDERSFAEAWAVREGHPDPAAVGEWAELMGPVAFDVYDSDYPTCYSWGGAFEMVRHRRRPVLGEGMYRYYESTDAFDLKLAACGRALLIAKTLPTPHLANETRVVASYVALAKAVYAVAERLATADVACPEVQRLMVGELEALEDAGSENAAAIRCWRSALGPEPWHHRVYDAIQAAEQTVADICDHVRDRYLY